MTDYPALSHLLGSYLHQDFGDEFPTATEAIRAYAEGEPAGDVRSAAEEISILLRDERFRGSPCSFLWELGCYYDPESEGMTPPDWLKQVQSLLRGDRPR